MRSRGTTSDDGRRREPDLARLAVAIARDLGVTSGDGIPSAPGMHRSVAEGGALTRPMVLWVGFGERDRRARIPPGAASEHLPEVRELPVRTVRGMRVWSSLVEHLPAGSLRRRMAAGSFRPGEAVTILLAVCDVLRRLHERGLGGVTLRAEDIRFRDDGCPVLLGVGGAGPLTEATARADSAAFVDLAVEVGAAVGGPAGDSLVESVRRAVDSPGGGIRETLLRESLPVAVRVSTGEPGTSEGEGWRTAAAAEESTVPAGASTGVRRVVQGVLESTRVRRPLWRMDTLLDGDPVAAVRAAVRRLVRERPKLALAVAAPLVTGVLVVAMLPGGQPDRAARSDAEATKGPGGSTRPGGTPAPGAGASSGGAGSSGGTASSGGAESRESAALSDGSAPSNGADGSGGSIGPGGSTASAEPGALDDPAEAALGLLEARRGGTGYAGARAQVEQRWGDAALVRVEPSADAGADSEPASLLLVRSEAGWRIRAVYS